MKSSLNRAQHGAGQNRLRHGMGDLGMSADDRNIQRSTRMTDLPKNILSQCNR